MVSGGTKCSSSMEEGELRQTGKVGLGQLLRAKEESEKGKDMPGEGQVCGKAWRHETSSCTWLGGR